MFLLQLAADLFIQNLSNYTIIGDGCEFIKARKDIKQINTTVLSFIWPIHEVCGSQYLIYGSKHLSKNFRIHTKYTQNDFDILKTIEFSFV